MNRFACTRIRWPFAAWAVAMLLAMAALPALWLDASAAEPAPGGAAPAEAAPAVAPAAEEAAAPPAAAGEAPTGEAAEGKSGAEGDESLGFLIFLNAAGFAWAFYIGLGLFSVFSLAVIMERLTRLRRARVIPGKFVRRLRGMLSRKEDTVESYRTLCESSHSPISNILRAGLTRAGRPLPEVEKAMEDAAAREMATMRSRNRPLSVIGSVAPLLGLLGTVVGMIFAFRVSSQAGLGKAELLAEGIYLALMTTAAGLTIAIPSLLFSAWFNATAEKFMRDIDEVLLETLPSFTRMEQQYGNGPFTPSMAASEALAAGTG